MPMQSGRGRLIYQSCAIAAKKSYFPALPLQSSRFRQKLHKRFAELAKAFDTIQKVFGAGLRAREVGSDDEIFATKVFGKGMFGIVLLGQFGQRFAAEFELGFEGATGDGCFPLFRTIGNGVGDVSANKSCRSPESNSQKAMFWIKVQVNAGRVFFAGLMPEIRRSHCLVRVFGF